MAGSSKPGATTTRSGYPAWGRRPVTIFPARPLAGSLGAALLRASLVLPFAALFTTPAQAQSITTFVSNTGQTDVAPGYYTHSEYRAQQFTTGNHAAIYRLSAIVVDIGRSCSIAPAFSLHESILNANGLGVPGNKVVDLTGSASSIGSAIFVPADETILARATRYFVVFKAGATASRLDCKVHRTISSNIDSGAASGWDIARRAVFSSDSGSIWRNTGIPPEDPSPTIQIAVRGTAVATRMPVTVTDDETASTEIALTVSPATVEEDSGATTVTVTGRLNQAPRASDTSVTVSVGATGDAATEGTDYAAVSDLTLTIDAGQTSGTATFTLTPADDDVDEGDKAIAVEGTAAASGLTVSGTMVTIGEDDGRGVEVSATTLTVPEGGSSTYTVVLGAEPTGTVTVAVSAPFGSDLTAIPSSLSFTSSTWDTAQTVTVTAAQDGDGENDETTLTHAVAGADYGANSVTADAVSVTVTDDETASMEVALTRFGRTVADQVLAAVDGRLRAARLPGVEAQLAGQRIGRSAAPGGGEAGEAEARAGLKALSDWMRGEDCRGGSGRAGECVPDGQRGVQSREATERDLLTSSSIALTGGTEDSGSTAVWAQGTVGRFDGREGAVSMDGEVVSGMLGVDWTRGRGTAGLVVARSRGEGGYRSEAGGSEVSSTLTGVYPYGRYAVNERLSVWSVVGYGAGEVELTPANGRSFRVDIDLAMAAAGLSGTVLDGGADGPTLSVKADGMIVRTSSERARGLAPSEAEVTRLRLGLEGSRPVPLEGGGVLTPSVELGLRQDGGDAETGFGADVGAGFAWEDLGLGLKAEVRGRGLLTHEDEDFRERGLSGSLAWDPTPGSGLGPSLTLRQTVGASAAGGMDALLFRGTMAGLAGNDDGEDVPRHLDLRLGYGMPVAGDRFIGTPEMGVGSSDAGREYSLGWKLELARPGRVSLDLSFEGTRSESANDDREPEHGVGLRLRARW